VKRYYGKIFAVLFLSAVMLFPALTGKAEDRVTRDPFAHPDLAKRKENPVARKRGKSPAEIIREEAATLELRATLRNGDWSMANINGMMVEEGEEIEGFTLLRIGEVEVLLRKKGVEVVLVMQTSNNLPTQ
jgi:hypothetical protein